VIYYGQVVTRNQYFNLLYYGDKINYFN
jgi:hypothetical protein